MHQNARFSKEKKTRNEKKRIHGDLATRIPPHLNVGEADSGNFETEETKSAAVGREKRWSG
jgi:hypothetical protein